MKQIFKSPKGISVLEVPIPMIGDKEVLVAVEKSVISSGTETIDMKEMSFSEKIVDKKRLLGKVVDNIAKKGVFSTLSLIKDKIITKDETNIFKPVGYSSAGRIVAIGKHVNNYNVGDRVACSGSGIAYHAEFASIPINLLARIPENVEYESAAFTTIGCIAMQGIRRANLSFGETVVIIGLGLIGLIAVQIAKAWGLVVIGIDINSRRCDLALELGADATYISDDKNLESEIKKMTNDIGADAVVIYAATKNSLLVNQSFDFCRHKGRVVAVGAIGMDLNRDSMYLKELDFVISTSYGPGRYDKSYEIEGNDYPIGYVRWTENRNMQEFLRLLSLKKINVVPLISNIFCIEQAIEAYQSLINSPTEIIANIFSYNHRKSCSNSEQSTITILNNKKNINSKIKVGIIGAGGFVKNNHIPNILNLSNLFDLVAISNKTPVSALTVGKKYKVKYVTTNYREILNDPEVDMVIIGTRHNNHSEIVINALKNKKHVLVEKPLALSLEEIKLIKDTLKNNPEVYATVGFNRRYSKLIQTIRNEILKDKLPVVINYRVNAGYIPIDSWVQSKEEGGGRLIGEACHFIDLISYIVNDKIIKSNITFIPISKEIKTEDNFIINLTFQNGSIGAIIYSSIGSKEMPKERLEIFSNNKCAVIDDFVKLQWYGGGLTNIKLEQQNKGHLEEIEEFAKLIMGKESLIEPFNRDIEISELSIILVNEMHNQVH